MVDLDNVFKYASPKYVYIRNAKLGIMKYAFMILIFLYVVVYEIIYSCTHLEPNLASGFGWITLQNPTNKCDPLDKDCVANLTSIDELWYCRQSNKNAPNVTIGAATTKKMATTDQLMTTTTTTTIATTTTKFLTTTMSREGCFDDPSWWDVEWGDGTSTCNAGPDGGIANNPSACKGHGDYSKEARRACPVSCGLCTTMQMTTTTQTSMPASTTATRTKKRSTTKKSSSTTTTTTKKATTPEKLTTTSTTTEKATTTEKLTTTSTTTEKATTTEKLTTTSTTTEKATTTEKLTTTSTTTEKATTTEKLTTTSTTTEKATTTEKPTTTSTEKATTTAKPTTTTEKPTTTTEKPTTTTEKAGCETHCASFAEDYGWHEICKSSGGACSGCAKCAGAPSVSNRRLTDDKANVSVGELITEPRECRFFDGLRLLWSPPQPSEIFIPTRYEQIQQEISSECYDPEINGVKGAQGGRSKFECSKPWITKETHTFYVADTEDFDLIFSHTFQQAELGLSGTSVDYQGFLAACKSNHPKSLRECKRMEIPNSDGDAAPEDLVGLTSAEEEGIESLSATPAGDRIRFGDLLKMAPVAQNYVLKGSILDMQLPPELAHSGTSLREVGGMLLLDVNYDNVGLMRPGITIGGYPSSFKIKPITYTYRPYFIPTRQNVKIQILQNGDFPRTRTIDKWYGVTVKMQFNGVLVKYSLEKVMTGLTNGLVLLAVSTTIVMYIAAYILPLKEKYNLLMYQMSEDFSDYKVFKQHLAANPSVKAESMYASGQLLLDTLKNETPLGSEDLLNILCTNEMRLNRLDGMDPKMTFIEGDEDDIRNKSIGDFACKFYEQKGVSHETVRKRMSIRTHLEDAAKTRGEYQSLPQGGRVSS